MKKIIIAPDSFKGSLTSIEVANAIEEGIKKIIPSCDIVKLPIADGGEGTMDTLVTALGGKKIKIKAHNPLMRAIEVEYGLVENGKTAILEMAIVSGLTLLDKAEQNPSTTYPSEQLHLIFPKFSVIFYFFRINNMRQKFMYFVCGVISNICQDINHPLFRIDVV